MNIRKLMRNQWQINSETKETNGSSTLNRGKGPKNWNCLQPWKMLIRHCEKFKYVFARSVLLSLIECSLPQKSPEFHVKQKPLNSNCWTIESSKSFNIWNILSRIFKIVYISFLSKIRIHKYSRLLIYPKWIFKIFSALAIINNHKLTFSISCMRWMVYFLERAIIAWSAFIAGVSCSIITETIYEFCLFFFFDFFKYFLE